MLFSASKHAFYAVYTRGDGAQQQLVTLRHGFSWWAFFFTIFWAIYHRLWRVFALGMAAYVLLITLEIQQLLPGNIINLFNFLLLFYFGLEGTAWRERRLQQEGYRLEDIVYAPDETAANIKALERDTNR